MGSTNSTPPIGNQLNKPLDSLNSVYEIINIPSFQVLNNYWIGPYGILVPSKIESIVSADGVSVLRMDQSDVLDGKVILTETQYKDKYAELGTGGYYFWKC